MFPEKDYQDLLAELGQVVLRNSHTSESMHEVGSTSDADVVLVQMILAQLRLDRDPGHQAEIAKHLSQLLVCTSSIELFFTLLINSVEELGTHPENLDSHVWSGLVAKTLRELTVQQTSHLDLAALTLFYLASYYVEVRDREDDGFFLDLDSVQYELKPSFFTALELWLRQEESISAEEEAESPEGFKDVENRAVMILRLSCLTLPFERDSNNLREQQHLFFQVEDVLGERGEEVRAGIESWAVKTLQTLLQGDEAESVRAVFLTILSTFNNEALAFRLATVIFLLGDTQLLDEVAARFNRLAPIIQSAILSSCLVYFHTFQLGQFGFSLLDEELDEYLSDFPEEEYEAVAGDETDWDHLWQMLPANMKSRITATGISHSFLIPTLTKGQPMVVEVLDALIELSPPFLVWSVSKLVLESATLSRLEKTYWEDNREQVMSLVIYALKDATTAEIAQFFVSLNVLKSEQNKVDLWALFDKISMSDSVLNTIFSNKQVLTAFGETAKYVVPISEREIFLQSVIATLPLEQTDDSGIHSLRQILTQSSGSD